MEEGWEYARLAHLTYHITEHTLDFARRRRFLRTLIATDPGKPAIFHFKGKKEKKKKKDDDDDDDEAKQQVPRMFLTFTGNCRACSWKVCDLLSLPVIFHFGEKQLLAYFSQNLVLPASVLCMPAGPMIAAISHLVVSVSVYASVTAYYACTVYTSFTSLSWSL